MAAPFTRTRTKPDVSHSVSPPASRLLSEVASQGINHRRSQSKRKRPWRDTHVVDAAMRLTFSMAAVAVMEANYSLHRGCNRLNVLLTINAEYLARDGESAQDVLQRIMQLCRKLYRNIPQKFAGVWRCEFGTDRYGGHHYHIAFHAPYGMRERLLDALQRWLDEPLDVERSSRSFRYSKWQAWGVYGRWHLRRIYQLDGALDYIAKVPKDASGEPLARGKRLGGARVREFGGFGIVGR